MNKIIGFLLLVTGAMVAQGPIDISIVLPSSYHDAVAGEEIWFVTKLANITSEQSGNVTLIYSILDSTGEERASKSVSVPLENTIIGNILIPDDTGEGSYLLQVTLNSSYGDSIAETTFNVLKRPAAGLDVIKNSLFDIIVDVPANYRQVAPGGELLTSIKLINVGSAGRVDVFLDYQIIGPENKVVLKKRETVAVETQANFVRTFDIPSDAKPGAYKIFVRNTYAEGKIADSEYSFTVINNKGLNTVIYYSAAGLLMALVSIFIIFKYTPVISRIHDMQMRTRIKSIVRRRLKQ